MHTTEQYLATQGLPLTGTQDEERRFLANDKEKIRFIPSTQEANTVFGKLVNLAVYREMVKVAGYAAVTDKEEFTFHLPVGFTGNMTENLKGGYGAKHILINPLHIERIHKHYQEKLKTSHHCASLMACLDEFLDLINHLNQPEWSEKVALAWEEKGKFVLAARMPFKTGHDNYLLCVFVPDTDYRFSIITLYPISQHTFAKIKYGDQRFTPIFAEEALPEEKPIPDKKELEVSELPSISGDMVFFKPEKIARFNKKKVKEKKPTKNESKEDEMVEWVSMESLADKGVIQESTCLKFIKRTKPELRKKLQELRGERLQDTLKKYQAKLQTLNERNNGIKPHMSNILHAILLLKEISSSSPNLFSEAIKLRPYLAHFYQPEMLHCIDFDLSKEREEIAATKEDFFAATGFMDRKDIKTIINSELLSAKDALAEQIVKYFTLLDTTHFGSASTKKKYLEFNIDFFNYINLFFKAVGENKIFLNTKNPGYDFIFEMCKNIIKEKKDLVKAIKAIKHKETKDLCERALNSLQELEENYQGFLKQTTDKAISPKPPNRKTI